MSKEEVDLEELKKSGYIIQRDGTHFTIRLRLFGGDLTSKQLTAIGEIAEKFGEERVHITTRQSLQIPNVNYEDLGEITKKLTEIGLPPGSCGPRVRNVVACVGLPECPLANINTLRIAKEIDKRYFGRDIPTKLKIAVTGCPNSCAKPQLNDVGIMGVIEPKVISEKCDGCEICVEICKEKAIKIVDGKAVVDYLRCISCGQCIRVCPRDAKIVKRSGYNLFVGGRVGRHPQMARLIAEFTKEKTIYDLIENSITLFQEKAKPGERFGGFIDRLGIDEVKRNVLK